MDFIIQIAADLARKILKIAEDGEMKDLENIPLLVPED